MSEKILVLGDEELRYISTIEGNKINLRHSNSEIWTSHTQGTHVGTLKDTGNNIKIDIGDEKLKLNYSEFVELFILMELKMLNDDNLTDEATYVKLEEE